MTVRTWNRGQSLAKQQECTKHFLEIQKIIRSNGNFKLNSFVNVTTVPVTDKNIHVKIVRDEFQDIYTASSFPQLSAIRMQFDTTVRWSIIPGLLKAMTKNCRISRTY